MVGTSHATVRLITAMCRTTPESRSVIQRGENLEVVAGAWDAVAIVIVSPPRP
jgi:hypothetical protein